MVSSASNEIKSALRICDEMTLHVSVRRVHKVLSEDANLQYRKMAAASALKEHHCQERAKWTTDCSGGSIAGLKSSLEMKKVWLWGSGLACLLLAQCSQRKRGFSKRQGAGGIVLIWSPFCESGIFDLAITSDNQNAVMYTNCSIGGGGDVPLCF